jgi:hypothetical protein
MSNYQPKDGNGALFKNDKGDNPARPDYRGDLMVGGVVYEVSGWIKPMPKDASQKFMSLAAKPKEQRQSQAPQRRAEPDRRQRDADNFDDPPF